MQKVTIKELSEKTVNTKFGEKKKWVLTDSVSGRMYDSFHAGWNQRWKAGDTIYVFPEQVSSREWEGKTYYTLKAPNFADLIANLTTRVGALERAAGPAPSVDPNAPMPQEEGPPESFDNNEPPW